MSPWPSIDRERDFTHSLIPIQAYRSSLLRFYTLLAYTAAAVTGAPILQVLRKRDSIIIQLREKKGRNVILLIKTENARLYCGKLVATEENILVLMGSRYHVSADRNFCREDIFECIILKCQNRVGITKRGNVITVKLINEYINIL